MDRALRQELAALDSQFLDRGARTAPTRTHSIRAGTTNRPSTSNVGASLLLDGRRRRVLCTLRAMPKVELNDMEMVEAARGQRALRAQVLADAQRQGSSSTRTIFERSVKFHEALVEKFEQAQGGAVMTAKELRVRREDMKVDDNAFGGNVSARRLNSGRWRGGWENPKRVKNPGVHPLLTAHAPRTHRTASYPSCQGHNAVLNATPSI
jgi:hypothetical protein